MAVTDQKIEEAKRNSWPAGRWVVVAMFLFAIGATATLYFYWNAHISPFLPLQKALAEKYPDCRPKVEGGQRKMHKGSPKILRVTMKIEFDPTTKKGNERAEKFSKDVAGFVREVYEPLQDYEYLELHFYWPEPEKEIKQVHITYGVANLVE